MMQQPMNTNPVQVVVLAQPGIIDRQSIYKNMKKGLARQLIGLGVIQVLIGILCIIFQGVGVGLFVNGGKFISIDFIGHGFWTGLLFQITGSLGIAGGINRSRCQVIAFNVLSIFCPFFAGVLINIAVPGAILYVIGNQEDCYHSDCDYTQSKTGTAMEAMMAILGLIEFIVAIWSSVVCCTIGSCCCSCGGACCCPQSPIQNQYLMTSQPFAGQQQYVFNTEQSTSNQQPQQPVYLTSAQQFMFSPNLQQSMSYAPNLQQPIFGLDTQQQMVQYNPPYNEQWSAYTPLPAESENQGSCTELCHAEQK